MRKFIDIIVEGQQGDDQPPTGSMYVIYYDRGRNGYVEKRDGIVILHDDPRKATKYASKDEAQRGKVGHHPDMGGDGFFGRVEAYNSALERYRRAQKIRDKYNRRF